MKITATKEQISTLPTEFVGRGEVKNFKFRRRIGNPRAFVYQVDTNYPSTHYEVFLAKWSPKFKKLSYPGSKSFGKWAWSFTSYPKALVKFNELINESKK